MSSSAAGTSITHSELLYPLQTEFLCNTGSPSSLFLRVASWLGIAGDSQIQSFRGPFVFLFLGVLSAGLSIASDSALLRIPVKHVKGWAPDEVKCVKVGYMYETNYGPVYLAIAPAICFFGFAAMRSVQRWDKLAGAAKGNRLVFNRAIVAGLILGSFGVTFGSEFMPYRARTGELVWGDYGGLAFGYVQAHAIAKYESGKGIPSPRRVKSADPGLNENTDLIVAEAPNGPVPGELIRWQVFNQCNIVTFRSPERLDFSFPFLMSLISKTFAPDGIFGRATLAKSQFASHTESVFQVK